MKIGILSISDPAHESALAESGAAVRQVLQAHIQTEWETAARLVPNDAERIEATLIELCDHEQCSLILTLGGIGPHTRDITPEVTESICEHILPGFGEEMRRSSFKTIPTAILSRQTAGTRGHSLIINLASRPAAVEQHLNAVLPAIPECLSELHAPGCTLRSKQP